MDKKSYKKLFKSLFKKFPIDNYKVFDEIDRANYALLEIRDEYRTRLHNKYYFCSKCNKYYLKNTWKVENARETNYGVTVYLGYGYGNDDEIADITYDIKYRACPKCGDKAVIDKTKISESNRRNRYN